MNEHDAMLALGFTGVHGFVRCEHCGHNNEVDTRPSTLAGTDKLWQLADDALNVITVYDDHTEPENRGPWRDRLMAWAKAALAARTETL